MARDMPMLSAPNYVSTIYAGDDWEYRDNKFFDNQVDKIIRNTKARQLYGSLRQQATLQLVQIEKEEEVMIGRRMIQVIIVDPNENIPLEQCLLYLGVTKLTDATDQELFFELDIKSC